MKNKFVAPPDRPEPTPQEPLCDWYSARNAIAMGIYACYEAAKACDRSARNASDEAMLRSAENHRVAAGVMEAFLRQNLHDPNCSRIGKPCQCQSQIDHADVAVPARAHHEETKEEKDVLSRVDGVPGVGQGDLPRKSQRGEPWR